MQLINHSPNYYKQQISANISCHHARAKETIYMCMVKVIEYKVETQTVQCHLEGYSWKKGIMQIVSSKKGIVQVVSLCTL